MARVDTYLNFEGRTREAFDFYQTVFGTEPVGPVIHYGHMPMDDWELSEQDKQAIMHISLPITGGHLLMGNDVLTHQSGETVSTTTFSHIVLNPDSKDEADQLFAALSDGGTIEQVMIDVPWGACWGNLVDKFGVRWMVNFDYPAAG